MRGPAFLLRRPAAAGLLILVCGAAAAGETPPTVKPARLEPAAPAGPLKPAPADPAAPVPHGGVPPLKEMIAARIGGPVLVVVWATWCAPCVKEIPMLNHVGEYFAGDGLTVIGVSVDSLTEDDLETGLAVVDAFCKNHAIQYPLYYYSGNPNALGDALGWTGAIPYAALIDYRGKIVERWPTVVPEGAFVSRLEEMIREMRGKKGWAPQAPAAPPP